MASNSVFVSRLRGLRVVDTGGDTIGKVRDVVIQIPPRGRAPRIKGLVVELFARKRIFVNMGRVLSIDGVQVAINGVINTHSFKRFETETLVIDDLFDAQVTWRHKDPMVIYDVGMQEVRNKDWEVSEIALVDPASRRRFGRKPDIKIVDWDEVDVLQLLPGTQGTDQLLAELEDMKPADVAQELHDLEPDRRLAVAGALGDQKLADALEEMPEDEQIELISALETERAADILEEMDPDDAADLIAELDPAKAEELLGRMEPDEASDVRRLMVYEEFTAGGMMTSEPVVLAPDQTIADALAMVRNEDLSPAMAGMVFVCRPPLDTPTGRFLGGVHLQRLLREPPSTLVSALVDSELEPLPVDADLPTISRYFASYDLVVAPVVDPEKRLVGAVTVDDVLDHMLPDDWRGEQMDGR
ncbi:magnesium transporter MgtE N-terminal domain-containing protein [Granulicoccus phenolivorans]|uniref:magnesium transporter MgtE N-terminal domain-containing protein n=1 Tax=Granulicoccus phenolivorans TaxID=266854 RepID=UPI00040F9E6F|nr:CBS domain-containing protein [Granulicoccus phenolivorans]